MRAHKQSVVHSSSWRKARFPRDCKMLDLPGATLAGLYSCYLCGYTKNMAVVDPYNRLCQILEGTTLGQLTEQPRIRKVIPRRAKRFAELFKWTENDGLHQTMWLTYTPLWPTSSSCDLGMSPGAITTHCSEPAEQHLLKP